MEHLTIAGKYRIVRKLGRGAFGTTYLAENLLGDTGKVVVKIAGPSDDVTAKRFQQEARVLGRLGRHPHIVSLYDAGVLEDGRPFLVMGWVEGQSLEEILDERGTLSLQDAFKVVDTLLDALHYAHSHRHIHRDIKPSNVLVRKDGLSSGDVVLTDFGALGRLEFLTDQTITGELVGTPTYMAPEQLRGEPQSRATDIYGVGTLLYRMIYGTPPYEGSRRIHFSPKSCGRSFPFQSNLRYQTVCNYSLGGVWRAIRMIDSTRRRAKAATRNPLGTFRQKRDWMPAMTSWLSRGRSEQAAARRVASAVSGLVSLTIMRKSDMASPA